MRQVLVVVHQATSSPGLVGQHLRSRGYTLDIRCPAVGDRLPQDLTSYAAVIVFGGPMSANDDDTLPFIRTELDWIPQVLETDTPYLGICLGAQLLARVLGASVQHHPDHVREIGYYPLQPTAAGRQARLITPMHVYHWHSEGFELPSGAMPLAVGDTFPNQAFAYGDRVYGLQFHPEITATLIETWTTRGAEQLSLPGAQPRAQQLQLHQDHGAQVSDWLGEFLMRWLQADDWSQRASA